MIKAIMWPEKDLKGTWECSLKIDGVRMLRDSQGKPVSRAGKPLYNLDSVPKSIVDAEIYDTDWESSISLCRSSVNGEPVPLDKVYSLDPIDSRLVLDTMEDPTYLEITSLMELKISEGFEGLMLQQGDKLFKVKPRETYDVPILGYTEGKGRNAGRIGAIITPLGNVGSGLTDELREIYHQLGTIIEVEAMGLTSGGKFRHPRFKRVREDKPVEEEYYTTG